LNQAQVITLYQPLLHRIAYNLLRCKADAEDVVQETFIKWLTIDHEKIENTKAYLIKAVTNNCLNHIQSLKKKKEEYWDSIQLSELLVKFKESDFAHIDLEKELSAAFKVIQTKLEPLERAAYLLKEVFDYEYDEIQKVLGKKADHCRQILSRARKKLENEKGKIRIDDTSNLFESFKAACTVDNANDFIQHLKADISNALQQKK
jgi:RNA polymerase sigma factor (sigma-70 family)